MGETKEVNEVKEVIDNLDLGPIKFKLVEEKGWSKDFADEIEEVYKGFLYLNAKYPDQPLVPSEAMDEMWHTHILDTEKYMKDCDAVFGRYLHHFPYFGIRNEQDAECLQKAFAETQKVFQEELDIDLQTVRGHFSDQAATCYGRCGNSVRPETAAAGTCYGACGNSMPSQIRPTFN